MFWIGTSGYQYAEWKGKFYPQNLPATKMLGYYAEHFSSVEINYTFFRLPNQKTIDQWQAAVPHNFSFSFKAPKQITHIAKLQNCKDAIQRFSAMARQFGPKLGLLLFQLPPYLKKDLDVLSRFCDDLTHGMRAAFEFRHESWMDDAVFALLRERNLALCMAHGEQVNTPVIATAGYVYARLRGTAYTDADIIQWANDLASLNQQAPEIYVYFKHEEHATGPRFAQQLRTELGKIS